MKAVCFLFLVGLLLPTNSKSQESILIAGNMDDENSLDFPKEGIILDALKSLKSDNDIKPVTSSNTGKSESYEDDDEPSPPPLPNKVSIESNLPIQEKLSLIDALDLGSKLPLENNNDDSKSSSLIIIGEGPTTLKPQILQPILLGEPRPIVLGGINMKMLPDGKPKDEQILDKIIFGDLNPSEVIPDAQDTMDDGVKLISPSITTFTPLLSPTKSKVQNSKSEDDVAIRQLFERPLFTQGFPDLQLFTNKNDDPMLYPPRFPVIEDDDFPPTSKPTTTTQMTTSTIAKQEDDDDDSSETMSQEEDEEDESEKDPECFTLPDVFKGTEKMAKKFKKSKTWKGSFGALGKSMKKAAKSVGSCVHRVFNGVASFLGLKTKRSVPVEKREDDDTKEKRGVWTETKKGADSAKNWVEGAGSKVKGWLSKRMAEITSKRRKRSFV